jgi:GDP-L-fucose synthase
MSDFYAGRPVLVTGGTGMIGRPLVDRLVARGARVRVVSRDDPSRAHPAAEFFNLDLTRFEACAEAAKGMEIVFHLAGVKGSPQATLTRPASFFVPMLLFNTNMMEAARQACVERYLFTSSVGVYAPTDVFREDDVWKTFPSPNDRFAGWAKRIGELQAEAYAIEYGWKGVSIVRPANVYGPFDNFDPVNAMVIPSLIRRAMDGENPLTVWGDGSQIRDFIHCDDVADGILFAVERGIAEPLNIGSGEEITIRRLVEIITANLPSRPDVAWDASKPSGDRKRLLDMTRARSYGWSPRVRLEDGIRETMAWYGANRAVAERRYSVFHERTPA